MIPVEPERLLSETKAARRIGHSLIWLNNEAKAGHVEFTLRNGKRCYTEESLLRLMLDQMP